jgi:hypothetical protein
VHTVEKSKTIYNFEWVVKLNKVVVCTCYSKNWAEQVAFMLNLALESEKYRYLIEEWKE